MFTMTVHSNDVHTSPKTEATHTYTTGGRTKTVWSVLVTEYYSAMERNNTLTHATMCMSLGHMNVGGRNKLLKATPPPAWADPED